MPGEKSPPSDTGSYRKMGTVKNGGKQEGGTNTGTARRDY